METISISESNFSVERMKGCGKVMKAVIYARQSSGDEEQSASVEQQILNCKKLAEDRNLIVTGIFQDLNISGKTYPDTTEAIALASVDSAYKNWVASTYQKTVKYRKGLADVINSLKNVDYVLLDDFTRLMRPLQASYLESHVVQKLRCAGVKLWCVKEGIKDLGNFSDNLVSTLISQINANQLEIQRQKSISALRTLRDSGYKVSGGRIYGYRYIFNKKFEIIPEEAEAVRKAFELGIKQVPYLRICRVIGEMLGKDVFHRATLNNMLRRPEYAGFQYNSSGELIESKSFSGIAIISFSQFLKMQERLSATSTILNHDRKDIYPFTGLCYCGYCGGRMIVRYSPSLKQGEDKMNRFFTCNSREIAVAPKKECNLARTPYEYTIGQFDPDSGVRYPVQESDLENPMIPEKMKKLGLFESLMPIVAIPLLKEYKKNLVEQSTQDKIQKCEAQKQKQLDYERKLGEMLLNGNIDDEQFKLMAAGSKEKREELSRQIIELMKQTSENRKEELRKIQEIIYALKVKKIDKYDYKKYAQKAISKIRLFAYNVEIELVSGSKFSLEKIPERNSRVLPNWSIEINEGKANVTYYYKSFYSGDKTVKTIFENDEISISVAGKNPNSFEKSRFLKEHGELQ